MKTVYIVDGCRQALILDNATGKMTSLPTEYGDIDEIYVAPEDLSIRFTQGSEEKIVEAKKGDIIVKFYNRSYITNRVVVVKNNKWKENLVAKELGEKKHELEMEAWAKSKKLDDCACECACNC